MTLGVILAIGESFSDLQEKGQAARMVDYNIKSYAKNFEEVYIFSYADEKWPLPKNCHLIANKLKLPRYIYALVMPLIKWEEFRKCDIFRCFQITGALPALISKVIFRKKFIFNYGYDYQSVALMEGKVIRSLIYAPLAFLISIFSSKIIITSKTLKNKLPRLAKAKIKLIPNGVDTKLFAPAKTPHESKNKILFVGRLEKEKNLFNLLKALTRIKNVHLTVIGSGSLEHDLKTLAKNNKLFINFIPKVNYHLLPKYYQKADIFILPSFSEGHSKVLLEAQASGLGCIVSDIHANRQIVKDHVNGIFCKTTEDGIYQTTRYLLKNKALLTKIGTEARKNALFKFDVEKLIEEDIKQLKSIHIRG